MFLKAIHSASTAIIAIIILSSVISMGYAAPERGFTIHADGSQVVQVWFDAPPQLTVLYPPAYSFNVAAKTSTGLWITSLHWDFGDGSTKDVVFCCQSQVDDVQNHIYKDQANYIITVTACDNAGNCSDVCVSLKPDFTLSASPSSQSVVQGQRTTYDVTVGSVCGGQAEVNLGVSSSPPPGVTWNLNANSGNTPFSSVLTVQTTPSTPVGSYTLTITGNATIHTTMVTLDVTSLPPIKVCPPLCPNFTLSINPTSLQISPESSPMSVVATIQSWNNFSSPVLLASSGVPAGMSVSFSTNPLTPSPSAAATSEVVISITCSAVANTYPIQITATSGSITRQETFGVTVTGGCIPGFPVESILAGLGVGILALGYIKRTRRTKVLA
ncbi:MAG TPA: PKD domain-containing protein [Candidatus Acidoferrum sp.]|nr:PKD domain-containing protein [Candidatus Acidoferrum sp.]